ncbi:hypothetical protein COHA_002915 [Chlorella ohadii]|uniref:Uncharacterized protein n=1 Tax=Chlorella ohadii TaxID=2649997 RepID=A0AAD5DSD8_9CHLO|nr:hypothetical protein COHA_002915 [Chlorella ohadii]
MPALSSPKPSPPPPKPSPPPPRPNPPPPKASPPPPQPLYQVEARVQTSGVGASCDQWRATAEDAYEVSIAQVWGVSPAAVTSFCLEVPPATGRRRLQQGKGVITLAIRHVVGMRGLARAQAAVTASAAAITDGAFAASVAAQLHSATRYVPRPPANPQPACIIGVTCRNPPPSPPPKRSPPSPPPPRPKPSPPPPRTNPSGTAALYLVERQACSSGAFASARCTCAEEQWQWAKTNKHWWWHDRHSISLTPAVGSSGLQLWRMVSVDGGPLVPGAAVTLQNTARAACGGYIAAAAAHCGEGQAQLSGDGRSASAQWVLRAGPKPLSFMLESKGASWSCPRRWLGAPGHCGDDSVGLYAAGDPHATLIWLVLPA